MSYLRRASRRHTGSARQDRQGQDSRYTVASDSEPAEATWQGSLPPGGGPPSKASVASPMAELAASVCRQPGCQALLRSSCAPGDSAALGRGAGATTERARLDLLAISSLDECTGQLPHRRQRGIEEAAGCEHAADGRYQLGPKVLVIPLQRHAPRAAGRWPCEEDTRGGAARAYTPMLVISLAWDCHTK